MLDDVAHFPGDAPRSSAEFIARSQALSELNTPAMSVIARIPDNGRRSGVFVRDIGSRRNPDASIRGFWPGHLNC